MPNLNKVQIIGHLGRDPEIRHSQEGKEICNFPVAASEKWSGGEHTEWFKVVAFGRQAEVLSKYLSKGSPIYIEGTLRTRKWQDKEGQDRWSTEVICLDFQFLGGKDGGRRDNSTQDYTPTDDNSDEIPF